MTPIEHLCLMGYAIVIGGTFFGLLRWCMFISDYVEDIERSLQIDADIRRTAHHRNYYKRRKQLAKLASTDKESALRRSERGSDTV